MRPRFREAPRGRPSAAEASGTEGENVLRGLAPRIFALIRPGGRFLHEGRGFNEALADRPFHARWRYAAYHAKRAIGRAPARMPYKAFFFFIFGEVRLYEQQRAP